MTLRLWALLILLSLLWGGSFFFNEIALLELTPYQVVTYRVCLAAIVLWLYIVVQRKQIQLTIKQVKDLSIMAAMNNVLPFLLIVWGQTFITSGLASILNATVPLFAVVLAHFMTADEKLAAHKIWGVLLGVFGVIALIGPGALLGQHNLLIGQLACLTAALLYALSSIYGKRLKAIPPVLISAATLTAGSVYMLIFCFVMQVNLVQSFSVPALLSVVMLGVVSTALAFLLYFRILAEAGATNITLVAFLIPVSAIMLGVVFLNERLSIGSIAGMLLIFAGLIVIDGRLRHRINHVG